MRHGRDWWWCPGPARMTARQWRNIESREGISAGPVLRPAATLIGHGPSLRVRTAGCMAMLQAAAVARAPRPGASCATSLRSCAHVLPALVRQASALQLGASCRHGGSARWSGRRWWTYPCGGMPRTLAGGMIGRAVTPRTRTHLSLPNAYRPGRLVACCCCAVPRLSCGSRRGAGLTHRRDGGPDGGVHATTFALGPHPARTGRMRRRRPPGPGANASRHAGTQDTTPEGMTNADP